MAEWTPKTRLGKMVFSGEVTTMSQALATKLPLREPEIVDALIPDLKDEVLDLNMVQRMTDSGRRVKFAVTCVVGNGDGFVGIGRAKGKEVGPTIRKAIDNAKLNVIEIKRGCGSWECACGSAHSLPFTVSGKSGSVEVTFKPAPRGIGLAVGDVAKSILHLAGVKDSWGFAVDIQRPQSTMPWQSLTLLREPQKSVYLKLRKKHSKSSADQHRFIKMLSLQRTFKRGERDLDGICCNQSPWTQKHQQGY